MVQSLSSESRLWLSQAAQELDVSVSTLYRWRLQGVRGHKLPTILIGGRRAVLRADLDEFLARLSQPREDFTLSSSSSTHCKEAAEAAARELKREGFR